jgi:O-antigen/teichoic acid export membrane protein
MDSRFRGTPPLVSVVPRDDSRVDRGWARRAGWLRLNPDDDATSASEAQDESRLAYGQWRRSLPAVRRGVRQLLRSPTALQSAGFTGASLLANVFALIATALLTRNLTTREFGSFSFSVTLLFLVALVFDFGLFSPAARLAATTDGLKRREVVGCALLVYLPVGAAFSATIFALSFVVDSWFHVDASHALRVAALPASAFPFVLVLQRMAEGTARLHVASVSTALAQLLFAAFVALALVAGSITTTSALTLRSVALLLATGACAVWLRPIFRAARRWVPELLRQTREWGLNAYVGRILSIGTYNMDVLLLAIWTNSRSVGFYSLAGSLATASGLPIIALAAALFAPLARQPTIARRWIVISISVGALCALIAWLLAEPVIRIFFSARYLPAAGLVLPLALAQFVRGVTGIFNTFFSAHGRGRDMRNAALVLTISNLVFNFALIPPFGARGAAWASFFALFANLVAYLAFYRRFLRKPSELPTGARSAS